MGFSKLQNIFNPLAPSPDGSSLYGPERRQAENGCRAGDAQAMTRRWMRLEEDEVRKLREGSGEETSVKFRDIVVLVSSFC